MTTITAKMTKLSLFVLIAAAGMLPVSDKASAMSCNHPTAAEHIARTDLVFFGRVNTIRNRDFAESQGVTDWYDDPIAAPDKIATFDVLRQYKGTESSTVDIEFYSDGGNVSGWGFRRGTFALIFARKVAVADKNKTIGYLNYCDMILYYSNTKLLPDYWEILVPMSKGQINK